MRRAAIAMALLLFAAAVAPSHAAIHISAHVLPAITHSSQGYLGVDIRDVTEDQARALKLKQPAGAVICLIDHDGPALKAGLRVNDIILKMNGQTVQGEEQLRRMLRETPAGRSVAFVIVRDGVQHNVTAVLANREDVARQAWEQHFAVPGPAEDATIPDPMDDQDQPAAEQPRSYPGFGFIGPVTLTSSYTGALLDEMGPQLQAYFGAAPGVGLLVKSVDADSPAASAGLRAGDVVVQVNGQSAATREDWLRALQGSHGKPLAVGILRDHRSQTLSLSLASKKHSELHITAPAWVPACLRIHHRTPAGELI